MSLEKKVDYKLLERCQQKDRKAQREMYIICFEAFMPVCRRYSNSDQDARSLLNGGFLKICQNLSKYKQEVPFLSWAKRVTVNSIIDEHRKNRKYFKHIFSKEQEHELEFEKYSSENDVHQVFEHENVMLLLDTLPVMTRKVMNLYVFEGYKHAEIGDLLGISESTSKWHLFNGKKKLRDLIQARG